MEWPLICLLGSTQMSAGLFSFTSVCKRRLFQQLWICLIPKVHQVSWTAFHHCYNSRFPPVQIPRKYLTRLLAGKVPIPSLLYLLSMALDCKVSAQLASTPVWGGSYSGSSILSKLSFSPHVFAPPTSYQSSSSSGLKLGGTSSLLSSHSSSSTGSLSSSHRLFTSTYQGSSEPQLAGGSASGLLNQSLSTESQNTPGSLYANFAASPLGFSQSTTGQRSYSQYTQSRVGTQLTASCH